MFAQSSNEWQVKVFKPSRIVHTPVHWYKLQIYLLVQGVMKKL